MTRSGAVVLVAALAGACSDAPLATAGALGSAIVNGVPSDESDNAVVDVYTHVPGGSSTRCTGTLVAPDVVVTALHCVSYYEIDSVFSCKADGTLVADDPKHGIIGQPVQPDDVEVHFGAAFDGDADAYAARIFSSGSTQICRNDIAIIVLDRELREAAPVAIRFEREVVRRESMRIVGFGQTESSGSTGRFARNGVKVTDVGPDDASATGSTPPRTFVLGEGACHGDSGGPAFSEETGALTGVYSLSGGPTCTSIGVKNVYTKVAPFAALFRQALESVGREPVVEPAPGAGTAGSAGSGGTSGGAAGSASRAGSGGEPEPVDPGSGSGSRRDGSCACSSVGGDAPGRRSVPALWAVVVAAASLRRRHGTRVSVAQRQR